MARDQEMLDALNKIEAAVAPVGRLSPAAVDMQTVCQEYAKIKGYLNIALPFIQKIPVYGAQIAAALSFLMGLADTLCPAK